MSDELPAEKIGAFHWVKLFITSATTLKWLAMGMVGFLGIGTVTNTKIQDTVMDLVGLTETEEEVLPIPDEETVVPVAAPGVNPVVRQSLQSMNSAINNHTVALKALRLEVSEMEERREAQSDAKDLRLDERLKAVEELVQ